MHHRLSLIILSISSIVLLTIASGCQKNRTINVKLTVVDAVTGEPVAGAKVFHEYEKRPATNIIVTEELGTTDEDGFIHIKKTIKKGTANNKLKVLANGYIQFLSYGEEVSISLGSKMSKTKKLERCNYFSISLKNENCFDETDSVWIAGISGTPQLFTGCVDATIKYGGYYDFTYWTGSSSKTFSITVKRNGVVTSFEQTTPMIFKETTPISIVY